MKEPVLQDKRNEHLKFCKYASELIERVSGQTQNANVDASLDRIRKVIWQPICFVSWIVCIGTFPFTKICYKTLSDGFGTWR